MFRRRQTLGRNRRELRGLGEAERDWVMDWWTLAEGCIETDEGQPSGPGVNVALAASGDLGVVSIDTAVRLLIAVRARCSLRAEIAHFAVYVEPLDVSMLGDELMVSLAGRPVDDARVGGIAAADDGDEVMASLQPGRHLVDEFAAERCAEIASGDASTWNGVVSVATYQLQKNVALSASMWSVSCDSECV